MTVLEFTVLGTPAPQGSKRPFVRGGRAVLVEERRDSINLWRGDVVRAAIDARNDPWTGRTHDNGAPLFDGPVFVTVEFRFTRPKNHYRTGRNAHLLRDAAPLFPAGMPDVDKLQRSTFDAITTAGVWKDDCQVVDVHATKRYAPAPGATIRIQTPDHIRATDVVAVAGEVL